LLNGLVLCRAGRFGDGRATIVLKRVAAPTGDVSAPIRAMLMVGPRGLDFTALDGLMNPRDIPTGFALRLLAPMPPEQIDGRLQLWSGGAAVAPAGADAVTIPANRTASFLQQ